jgi:hypothetical protein
LIFSRPKLLFHLVMDLGKARSQWDLTFDRGSVVERIDEHTDVIRLALKKQVRDEIFSNVQAPCAFPTYNAVCHPRKEKRKLHPHLL